MLQTGFGENCFRKRRPAAILTILQSGYIKNPLILFQKFFKTWFSRNKNLLDLCLFFWCETECWYADTDGSSWFSVVEQWGGDTGDVWMSFPTFNGYGGSADHKKLLV